MKWINFLKRNELRNSNGLEEKQDQKEINDLKQDIKLKKISLKALKWHQKMAERSKRAELAMTLKKLRKR